MNDKDDIDVTKVMDGLMNDLLKSGRTTLAQLLMETYGRAILDDYKYGDVFQEPDPPARNPAAMIKADKVITPGTMVKHTSSRGKRLTGLVVATKQPSRPGVLPLNLVVWSDGSMSEHVFCEPLF